MVIDTSALIAILRGEPESERLLEALTGDAVRLLSAVSALEASVVAENRFGPEAGVNLELLIHRAGIQVLPFDQPQMDLARLAYRRFGRGRHPAALNLGDCAAYALAKASAEPLLFIGEDFRKTDIPAVLPWE